MAVKTFFNYIKGEFFASDYAVQLSNNESVVASTFVRTSGSVPLLLNYVLDSLQQQLLVLGNEIEINAVALENCLIKTLNKNRSLKGGIIKIEVVEIRQSEVSIDFRLFYQSLDYYRFNLNKQGLTVDLFTFCPKPKGLLFAHPLACEFIFSLASRQLVEKNVDELILLNPSKRLACGIDSLVFLVRENCVLVINYDEGAIIHPMFSIIQEITEKSGLKFLSNQKLTVDDIELCDEMFIADMQHGIRWVVAYRSKRFYNRTSLILSAALDKLAFS
jgi:hypothetical protein